MKLKSIKTFGFKTFAEPTALEFADGITAIVGPNGSGKSNLIDAFRWALGEQSSKSLRSSRMEDVIFVGNERRKPLGLAEVSVVFDNSDRRLPVDFIEVEITRRAYRAGEIEYYINRNQCRLRDILDLLMGTGLGPGSYAIVSQGQIDTILSSKPTERRALFEETAGIAKFLARKQESLRRLEQTEANAIRINDLIAELDRRLPELDGQVRRANRYRKLRTRLRDLEILAYLRATSSRRAERDARKAEVERDEAVRSAAAAHAAATAAALANERTESYRAELQLEEFRTHSQTRRAQLAQAQTAHAAAVAAREALERQHAGESEDEHRVGQESAQLRQLVAGLEERMEPLRREVDAAAERQRGAEAELATARAQAEALARDTAIRAEDEFARANAEHREYASEVAAAQSRLHTIEELEQAMEGHAAGTRACLEAAARGELEGIEGVVSTLIDVEERYARALDVAFGARLSNVVTKRSQDAERAIEFLNRHEAGRATFLPLDIIGHRVRRAPAAGLRSRPGVIAYAYELVTTSPVYEPVVHFLIGNAIVVDRLASAIALAREGVMEPIVTLGGEQIVGGSAITGGRHMRERSLLARRAQANTLRASLGTMQAKLASLEQRAQAAGAALHADLESMNAQVHAQMAAAQARERELSAAVFEVRERYATLRAQRDAAANRLETVDRETKRSSGARVRTAGELAQLAARTHAAAEEVSRLSNAVQASEEQFDAAKLKRDASLDAVRRLEAELRTAELDEREAQAGGERLRMRLAEIEAELGMLTSQFAQNPATDEECRDVQNRYRDEPAPSPEELAKMREVFARLSDVNLHAESDRDELVQRRDFLREQVADLAQARELLLTSIGEIETQTQAAFNETFEAVAAAFAHTFARLFPGGRAQMWQTNTENLSETGIEIAVQPPGKTPMPLASLSGGERAMTAAALIFALIKVRPSPFYLLDEADAALDDANVARFSEMVREVATTSQIVLVTHNKQTMELADRLYGITMSEPGVSAIVSAELTQEEPQAAIA